MSLWAELTKQRGKNAGRHPLVGLGAPFSFLRTPSRARVGLGLICVVMAVKHVALDGAATVFDFKFASLEFMVGIGLIAIGAVLKVGLPRTPKWWPWRWNR